MKAAIQAYADQFLKPDLRHSDFTNEDLDKNPRVNRLTRDAYRWLYRFVTDEVDPYSPELWQDWSQIENALASLSPVLHHLDQVKTELRRAQRIVLGPLQAVPQMWQICARIGSSLERW